MPIYAVEFKKSAQKELKKLSPDLALRVTRAIYSLSSNPRKGNVRPMIGVKSWRLRVGDWRVIYNIEDKKLIILIIKVAHRSKSYK